MQGVIEVERDVADLDDLLHQSHDSQRPMQTVGSLYAKFCANANPCRQGRRPGFAGAVRAQYRCSSKLPVSGVRVARTQTKKPVRPMSYGLLVSWCPGETRSLRYGAPICWGEDVWFIGDAPKSAPKTRTTLPPRSLWVRVPVARRYARSSARPAGGGELHSSALPWRGPQTQQPAPQPCGRSVPARTLRCGAVGFRPLISLPQIFKYEF